ncbi:unnamed protein product [Cylicocyclus nassatus]|uniref:MADF domain-containing protein n=1 Tax=Cylicocyclus nassatus TaxID=53992 RepID=A0AA36GYQ0_CYLNA|nr:unnamed protein product [Cylicocyclus nassatus]
MGRLKLTPEQAFTDEERHFLAAVIQVYPCIWNECDPNYRDYQARVQAWSVIIEQFAKTFGREVTQQQMHKQYKNLRDVYMKKNRELKALSNAGEDLNGCIASKIYSWPFYRELEYLSSSAGSSELSISALLVEDEQLFDAESPQGQVDDKSQIEKVAEDNFIPSTPGSEVGTSAPSTRSRRMRKRRAAKECENSSSETELQVLEEVRNILKESAPQLKLEPEADPFIAIGSHLADRLRKLNSLDPLRCEEIRLKIDLLHVDISRAILEIQKKRPNLKE